MKSTILCGAGDRLGIVPAPQLIPTTLADVPGVFHASVRSSYGPAGGVGWTADDAISAAVAEALERFAAASIDLPTVDPATTTRTYDLAEFALLSADQQRHPNAPWREPARPAYVTGYRLHDDAVVAVPRLAVGLNDPDGTGVATSNGLAAGPSLETAVERALQEVIERDALMIAWLHGLTFPAVALPYHLDRLVSPLNANVRVVDITPTYSAWPVVAVCGSLPWRGRPRIGMGAACRPTFEAALEKAFLEWTQATLYVGVQMQFGNTKDFAGPDEVTTFEDHALYYSAHPQQWSQVPLVRGPQPSPTGQGQGQGQGQGSGVASTARQVVRLNAAGFDVVAVRFEAPDLEEIGLSVVRVLVPGLTSVNADHRWPLLGGETANWRRRFPDNSGPTVAFPSPYPHPLG